MEENLKIFLTVIAAKDRPEGLLPDEERIRKPQLIRMWKQRLQNLEPLKKTRPEYYERQKKSLEEVGLTIGHLYCAKHVDC